MSESNSSVKIKVEENGATSGSLGLLTSYTDSSTSEDEDDNGPGPENNLTKISIKNEPVKEEPAEKEQDMRMDATAIPVAVVKEEGNQMEYAEIRIKEEPQSDDSNCDTTSSANATETITDFAEIREKIEGERKIEELTVEDFLDESYVAAREIKKEVESGTDDSEPDSEDSEKEGVVSDQDEEDDDEDDEGTGGSRDRAGKKKPEGPKVKGELGLDDLPPIEDLHISVPHDQCKPIGVIKSVVEPLVIVEALPETPALNLDSVLFLDEGDRALGHIFDVIGPVKQPLYCVRFNSKEHIEKNKVEVGMSVYCAPKTPYTSFVFLAQLQRMKGSDASWMNDVEPPQEEQDYSDDEMERIVKKNKKRNRRARLWQATEEDAMYRETDLDSQAQNGGNKFRGRKRHFRNQNGEQTKSSSGNAVNYPTSYVPAFVPGFIPANYMNPYQPGYQDHYHRRGGANHRFGGHKHFQRFRHPLPSPPPMPPATMSTGYPCPPQTHPWRPPSQVMPTLPSNFNFTSFNPYQPFQPYVRTQAPIPRPQPPPPPPPPGE